MPQKWTGILCERYESLFRAMGETGSRAFLKQQREGMALFQFVVDVIHKHQESDTRPVIYGKDLIDELDRYLASNRTGGDRVDEFARMAGVSPEHMTRTLRRHTGLTPKKYFLRHRIGQARELLITSALSIGEIGSRCGFPDPYHFSKVFKQQTGMSPMAFRMHNPMAIGQKSTL
ncbi:helix-turn-helix transcriptional regulator [Kamptonema cortianum]|nr:helix-turn-helix transcriptional regulator [Kamptonema cortianum]